MIPDPTIQAWALIGLFAVAVVVLLAWSVLIHDWPRWPKALDAIDCAGIAGAAAMVYGMWQIYPPAAWILGGGVVLWASLRLARR